MKEIRKRPTSCSTASNDPVESNEFKAQPFSSGGRRRSIPQFSFWVSWGNKRRKISSLFLAMMGCSCLCIYSTNQRIGGFFRIRMWREDPSSSRHRVLHHDVGKLDISRDKMIGSHYLPQRPRMVGHYFDSAHDGSYRGTERLDANRFQLHRRKRKRIMDVSKDALQRQAELLDSREYSKRQHDPFETDTCKAQYDWQLSLHPNCNLLHEQDLTQLGANQHHHDPVEYLAHGYWRDVWQIQDNFDRLALKTMRYEHIYEPRNYDRHRRDALAMEQLTSSQWIMNIYGFCGNSGLFEFADGGALDDSIFAEDSSDGWNNSEKLVVAYQVASGIAAVHNYPKEGVAAIVHTDISTSQFVYVEADGIYKLNDFNRCRFIRWNVKSNTPCTFRVGNNPGTNRAPEEYNYEGETEKIDVYSMGNVFYSILTGLWPFEKENDTRKVIQLVPKGHRPPIDASILNSTDPFVRTILNATFRSWAQNPKDRATAREIQMYIKDELLKLGVKPS